MNVEQWQDVVSSWTIRREQGEQYISAPSELDLDAFEREFAFHLPSSFRAFVTVTGPGTLSNYFHVMAPSCGDESYDMPARWKWRQQNLPTFAASWKMDALPDAVKQLERLKMLFFGFDSNHFYWDPEDRTPGDGNEYGIYLVQRRPRCAEKLASTFDSFILDYCIGPRIFEYFTWCSQDQDDDEYPFGIPRASFVPVRKNREKAP